jgi:hypothetical protein
VPVDIPGRPQRSGLDPAQQLRLRLWRVRSEEAGRIRPHRLAPSGDEVRHKGLINTAHQRIDEGHRWHRRLDHVVLHRVDGAADDGVHVAVIRVARGDPTIVIPSVMVSLADGSAIKAGLPATGTVRRHP